MHRLQVLRLLGSIGETITPYQHFSLRRIEEQDITICAFFPTHDPPHEGLRALAGDGTLSGFANVIGQALKSNRYDIIHIHVPFVAVIFLLLMLVRGKFSYRRFTVYTIHSSYSNFSLRNRFFMFFVFAACARIVHCSHASYESFPRLYRVIGGGKVRIIPNGVDIDRIDRTASPQPRGTVTEPFKIVVVGRLIPLKNTQHVLEAFASLDACSCCQLIFVGDGPLRTTLEQQAHASSCGEHVQFLGMVTREEVYRTLAQADVLVSLSSVEGLPIAVLEAMACYCPVILSDIPPHREIVGDLMPLVSPYDLAGVVREILRIRDLPPQARQHLSQAHRLQVVQTFDLDLMLSRYDALYQEICTFRTVE